jgi:hypothetical protein
MTITWSFSAFAFFLVPFYLTTLESNNMFLLSTSLAIAEIISSIICLTLIHGRDLRKVLSFFCALTCFGTVGVMIFNGIEKGSSEASLAMCYLVLYVGIVTAFDLVYLLVNELFPTLYLATAYGVCNIVGRLITVLAPLVSRAPKPFPMLILAAYSGICIILPICLIQEKKAD